MAASKKTIFAIRVASYALGVIIMTFGIVMAVRSNIGVAPGSLIPYAVSKLSPLTIGQCSALFHVFCVLMQLLISRKPTIKLFLQFPMAYVVGSMMDLFYIWHNPVLPNLMYQVLLLIAGMFVFSLGIRIIVGSNLLISPADGLAWELGKVFGWSMSKGKLAFDIIVTVFTALLTLILASDPFLSVGIGTVICAIGTGPIIGLFTKLFPFFDFKEKTREQPAENDT